MIEAASLQKGAYLKLNFGLISDQSSFSLTSPIPLRSSQTLRRHLRVGFGACHPPHLTLFVLVVQFLIIDLHLGFQILPLLLGDALEVKESFT